jgi:hypothetical protein
MAIATGTPLGVITAMEEVYLEGAPNIYFQQICSPDPGYLANPDADGFYYNLTGTAACPVYQLACYEDVRLADGIEVNAVRCDTVGDKDVLQKRSHLELSLNLKSLFPLTVLTHILRGGTVTQSGGAIEKMGLGLIDNAKFYRVYMPKVYDEVTGDFLSITLHRAKFVDAWEIAMPFGTPWMAGIRIWGMADENKPAAQTFATIIRADPSAI